MKKLIFVVDDNDANLTAAALALEEEYRVLTMPGAQRMFLLLEKKRPDLILLDIEMPEMDGFDAIAALKARPDHSDIPVAFLTGHNDEEIVSRALKAGAREVIKKPIVAGEFLDRVRYLCGTES